MQCKKSVLILGEGNFSFSVAFHEIERENPLSTYYKSCIYATTLETRSACINKYKAKTEENIRFLEKNNVNVLHCVDATNLEGNHELCKKQFDKIIFNFPHTGKKAKIQNNRFLLKSFFLSGLSCLSKDSGIVEVSLCRGQGGTPFDSQQREACNTWKIVEMATYGGFVLTSAQPFPVKKYAKYESSGRRGRGNCFVLEGAVTHQFMYKPFPIDTWKNCKVKLNQPAHFHEKHITEDIQSLHSPFYTFTISFWAGDEDDRETASLNFDIFVRNFFHDLLIENELTDVYCRPLTGRLSLCYTITLCSKNYALSSDDIKIIEKIFRQSVFDNMHFSVR